MSLLATLVLGMGSAQMQAQDLGSMVSKLNSAAKEVMGSSSTSKVVTALLGTAEVPQTNILGTWKYKTPCLVFSSQSMLTSMGSNLVTSKVNSAMEAGLTKAGVKPGAMAMEFGADGNCTIKLGENAAHATYTLSGSTLTLTFPVTHQSVAMNVKLAQNTLQFAMKLDKLLALLQGVTDANKNSTATLNTIAALLKNYDGMQLGLQFTKQ